MAAWKTLYEYVRTLSEDRQYRGATSITLKELTQLFVGTEQRPGITGEPPDPSGGSTRCEWSFNPDIWTGWQTKIGAALASASTGTKRDVQSGNAQGGTVHKTNWGGKVANVAAPVRPSSNDHLGSAMDRYDVMMVAEIGTRVNAKGKTVHSAVMTRIAWSPSIGSSDERSARLDALLAGRTPPPLSRRPQGEMPSVSKDDAERWHQQSIARNKAASADSDTKVAGADRSGSGSNSGWKDKLAKHNADYEPHAQADRSAPAEDDPDRLFNPRDLKSRR